MPSPRTEFLRGAARWLWPAAVLTLAPKCLLCVAAYAGVGAALGIGGPELCGAAADSPAAWTAWLTWLGAAGGLMACGILLARRRRVGPT